MSYVQVVFFFTDTVKSMYSGRWDGDVVLWEDLARAFKAELIMVDLTTDERGQYYRPHVPFHRVKELDEVQALFPSHNMVYIEDPKILDGTISVMPLKEFNHPEQAIYVFGPDPAMRHIVPPDGSEVVTLPCGTVWAVSAAAMVLYDREAK